MVTASQIMSALQPYLTEANKINSGNPMKTSYDAGSVYIYKIPINPPVIVYTSSAAIDCDGIGRTECGNDPTYQGDTSCHDSSDKPLDPVNVSWYVIPESPNPFFDYNDHDISCAQAGLVIYSGSMQYGIFGDERGRDVGNTNGRMIGEVSYGMAEPLGIDPDPDVGGIESGVTYIIFTGSENVVDPPESTSAAQSVGSTALDNMMRQLGGGGNGGGNGGTAGITCSPACKPDEACLALLGFGCQKRQYIALAGGALLLVILLKR